MLNFRSCSYACVIEITAAAHPWGFLSVCVSVSVCLSIIMCVYMCASICLSVCISVCMCVSVCVSISIQRARRRQREAHIAELESGGRTDEAVAARYQPRWFEAVDDELSGRVIHKYRGGYWEAKEGQQWPDDMLDLWSAAEQ